MYMYRSTLLFFYGRRSDCALGSQPLWLVHGMIQPQLLSLPGRLHTLTSKWIIIATRALEMFDRTTIAAVIDGDGMSLVRNVQARVGKVLGP